MRQYLNGYETRVDPAIVPIMLRCYGDWIASNRAVHPFPGGRLQQPAWVLDYFDTFAAVDELADLERKRPDVKNLPNADDVL